MIYLRKIRSGNYEITNKENATDKIFKKDFVKFWNENMKSFFGSKIIKATYRLSQTYFSTAEEFLNFIKK